MTDEKVISLVINKWANWYQENEGMDACDINTGECMNFAEAVYGELIDEYEIKTDILSDAFFYDHFNDYDPEEMLDPSEYGGLPTYDYKKVGFPSHYWIYYNGKHYDSEVPSGIKNFFELPTVINFAKKYKALKEIKKIIREELRFIFEDINIPVNVGDEILTGKFKNKKTKVKSIGKNDKGDLTINDKSALRFRIPEKIKEGVSNDITCKSCGWEWTVESDDKNPHLCHKCGYDNEKNEFDNVSLEDWKNSNIK